MIYIKNSLENSDRKLGLPIISTTAIIVVNVRCILDSNGIKMVCARELSLNFSTNILKDIVANVKKNIFVQLVWNKRGPTRDLFSNGDKRSKVPRITEIFFQALRLSGNQVFSWKSVSAGNLLRFVPTYLQRSRRQTPKS